MESSQRLGARAQLGLRVVGAGLLAATGAIHLDLYLTGFKNIPTIGVLFLLQVIAAFGLAVLVLVPGGRLFAALGAGFAASTLGGYLLAIWFGLFGFREVRTTAGIVAGVIEVAAFAVLAVVALVPAAPGREGAHAAGSTMMARLRAGIPGAGRVIAGLSVLALVLLGVAVAGAGGSAATAAGSSGQQLKTTTIHGVTVLTNAKGFTLYWFAPDSPTRSACNGSCAQYWPPVPGHATTTAGITGTISTITRSDGSSQSAYNGHPLYTYVSDTAPGQANGNNLNINGGLWHEVTVSG
jgi:predicted lipoprotein with Yx(FWY)xxD motif